MSPLSPEAVLRCQMCEHVPALSRGAALRCNLCDAVLLVLVHGDSHYRLSLRGLTWLVMPETQ
jgi:hypothetical protein